MSSFCILHFAGVLNLPSVGASVGPFSRGTAASICGSAGSAQRKLAHAAVGARAGEKAFIALLLRRFLVLLYPFILELFLALLLTGDQGCPLGDRVLHAIIGLGRMDMLGWAIDRGCPVGDEALVYAASHGQLETLQFLHGKGVNLLIEANLCGVASNLTVSEAFFSFQLALLPSFLFRFPLNQGLLVQGLLVRRCIAFAFPGMSVAAPEGWLSARPPGSLQRGSARRHAVGEVGSGENASSGDERESDRRGQAHTTRAVGGMDQCKWFLLCAPDSFTLHICPFLCFACCVPVNTLVFVPCSTLFTDIFPSVDSHCASCRPASGGGRSCRWPTADAAVSQGTDRSLMIVTEFVEIVLPGVALLTLITLGHLSSGPAGRSSNRLGTGEG
jgi:hypothetical protein